jgi:hypothetical protein
VRPPAGLPTSSVDVAMHVYPESTIGHRLYPGEYRATVHVRGSGGELTLYASHDELVRLWDAFADAAIELKIARAEYDETGSGSAA